MRAPHDDPIRAVWGTSTVKILSKARLHIKNLPILMSPVFDWMPCPLNPSRQSTPATLEFAKNRAMTSPQAPKTTQILQKETQFPSCSISSLSSWVKFSFIFNSLRVYRLHMGTQRLHMGTQRLHMGTISAIDWLQKVTMNCSYEKNHPNRG